MTRTPAASVVMNCHNGEAFLRQALESVAAQTFSDWELVFWDNASTDASAAIAKGCGDRLRYFHGDRLVPLGEARNLAIAQARGELLCFLDCDDVWLPGFLERVAGAFRENPERGIVYANAFRVDAQGKILGLYSSEIPPRSGHRFIELLEEAFIAPFSATAIPRRLALEHGGFNADFNICTDLDLYLRIAQTREIGYIDEPLVRYRVHGGNTSRTLDVLIREEEAILSYWIRRRPDLGERLRPLARAQRLRHRGKWAAQHLRSGELLSAARETAQAAVLLLQAPPRPPLLADYVRRWLRFVRDK